MKTQSVISNQRSVVGAEPPHPEIEYAANQVVAIIHRQRRYLAGKDTAYLQDLIAAARDVAHHDNAFIRLGAQFNQGVAEAVLEERGAGVAAIGNQQSAIGNGRAR